MQTRLRGDVIYPSNIEPRSEYIKSVNATDDYDPLSYAIEVCHKRGIECHAWFVVYPLGLETMNKQANHKFRELLRRNVIKRYNEYLYLDPGNPQTDVYLLSLIKGSVSKR